MSRDPEDVVGPSMEALFERPTLRSPRSLTDDVHLVRFRCPECYLPDGQGQLVRGMVCESSEPVIRCLDCRKEWALLMVEAVT